ncbi:hypothetical protein CDV31_002903 [Fusarium ambrosium]|uniref:AAA+ ATPase domain-containing protein n=1 Tax=Fusarium ambrosium TaxID=131363 RepID=A0A428UV53_9HYPO|nr:hypothetical protein CDV31_002903 [Fusarium ambrosium]
METPFADEFFEFAFSLPPQPSNPTNLREAGTICETKRFDSFYNATGDRIVLPAGQRFTAKDVRNYDSALTVTTYWNSRQDLEKIVLEIKSPYMKAGLKHAVPEYHSFNIDARHITISGEPRCLFHYREELREYGAGLQQQGYDTEATRHMQHLMSYMWDVFAVEIHAFNTFQELIDVERFLEHKYLWMIFRPGDIVYVREAQPRAFLLERMYQSGSMWELQGHCVDYDGETFGFKHFSTTISSYDGPQLLSELHAVSFNYLPPDEQQAVKAQLVARGRKFVGIHGRQYLYYSGKSGNSPAVALQTRIMADRKGYDAQSSIYELGLSSEKKKFKVEDVPEQMTEDELMLCNNSVAGYSLRENSWKTFDIDSISEITFDSQAFDALILSDDKKQPILSSVRVHEEKSLSFDDLVKEKGRGMIFLLYGEPGVGKTLTAESVADYCRKPLLRLDAGTLGTTPSSVEKGLKDAFLLAERWHALLLLDEADIYLEQRKSKNLVHNGIVSVFLRMIEYYHGILFLTTNRIESFDRAFISRIHLSIYYPPLTQSSRRELLYTFLKQTSEQSAEALSITGALEEIAEEPLNGRQVRNLVRTACALAFSDDSAGGYIIRRHLEMALQPMKQFARNMEQVLLRNKQQGQDKEDDEEEQQVEEDPPRDEEEEENYERGEFEDEGEEEWDTDADLEDEEQDGEDDDEGFEVQPSKRIRLF